MPETPKKKPRPENRETDEREKDSWGEDQKKREYYYDDACGYETYDPNEDDLDTELSTSN